MNGRERWYEIRDGDLYQVSENDGATFLRRGAERTTILLCTVEEATTAYPEELAKAKGRTDD
jgi:hypothetical protein